MAMALSKILVYGDIGQTCKVPLGQMKYQNKA